MGIEVRLIRSGDFSRHPGSLLFRSRQYLGVYDAGRGVSVYSFAVAARSLRSTGITGAAPERAVHLCDQLGADPSILVGTQLRDCEQLRTVLRDLAEAGVEDCLIRDAPR
jgi:hypothetical protein